MDERVGVRVGGSLLLIGLVGSAGACVFPDTDVDVVGDLTNPGTVRIIEPIPLTPEADAACAEAVPGFGACPLPPNTTPFGLLHDEQRPLCVCPDGDGNELGIIDVYVEDPDVDEEGQPRDTILGALMLDVPTDIDPADFDPADYLAYENLLSPTTPAQRAQLGLFSYRDAIDRPTPQVRTWALASATTQKVDLCNDNDGDPLSPGLHTLRLVVTDRPWYVPVTLDEDGRPIREKGTLVRVADAEPMIGVPDLPGGATYAVANWVFRCLDAADPSVTTCNCKEPTSG